MRSLHILRCLLMAFIVSTTAPVFAGKAGQTLTKTRVLADLDSIHHIFEVKYAPKQWKYTFSQWDLTASIEEAKNKIKSHPAPTIKECQVILRDFFNSTQDYHVGVRFYSTESATLPFLIKGTEGRYFISYVDREEVSKKIFPFEEGDEILTFDGRAIDAVIQDLRIQEFGHNHLETDQALAELALTQRRGDLGQQIPQGYVEISGYKKHEERKTTIKLEWNYTPEKIKDFSKLNLIKSDLSFSTGLKDKNDLKKLLKSSQFFQKCMVASFWDNSYLESSEMNKHALGARTSFIPALGNKIWKSASDSHFDAYIFKTACGKQVGYVRLSHYMGDEEELQEFGTLMNFFQCSTDSLIIDQINNPGGSVFYLYALAATLADKPLYAPKHHLALTQEEVYIAHLLLPYLEQVSNDITARLIVGETLGGYPVDYEFVQIMKKFCRFMIHQWESGKLYSDPTHLFGVDYIKPHTHFRYTKPVLLLINSLDFSGGDFFPAILQDNARATVLGTRTAGAGGYVLSTEFPNQCGMKNFLMTGSLAERINKQPIENLGVQPDIYYNLSVVDLQEGYPEYVQTILETIDSITK